MHSCLKWPLSRLRYFGEIYSSLSNKLHSMKLRWGQKIACFHLIVLQIFAGIYCCIFFANIGSIRLNLKKRGNVLFLFCLVLFN